MSDVSLTQEELEGEVFRMKEEEKEAVEKMFKD
jgi:hypothetical protein